MRALLLLAHGSRQPEANEAVRELAARIRHRSGGGFQAVRHAFLELAAPSAEEVVAELVAEGAGELVIIPFFLAPGRHLTEDLPALRRRLESAHPGLEIRLTGIPGQAPGMVDLLLGLAREAT